MRRYAAKRDANERPIIDALKAAGCEVQQVSETGFVDLIVYRRSNGLLRLLEVKQRKGRLREAQKEKFPKWPVWITRTVEAALEAMEIKTA